MTHNTSKEGVGGELQCYKDRNAPSTPVSTLNSRTYELDGHICNEGIEILMLSIGVWNTRMKTPLQDISWH